MDNLEDKQLAEAKRKYSIAMLSLAGIGLLVNVASIILLSAKKRKSMFHSLLKVWKKLIH